MAVVAAAAEEEEEEEEAVAVAVEEASKASTLFLPLARRDSRLLVSPAGEVYTPVVCVDGGDYN